MQKRSTKDLYQVLILALYIEIPAWLLRYQSNSRPTWNKKFGLHENILYKKYLVIRSSIERMYVGFSIAVEL